METHFEMEVGAGGASCAATQPQCLPSGNYLHGLDIDFREMAINGFQPVVVAHHDEVAVCPHRSGNAHHAVEGTAHGLACLEADVDPTVGTVPTPTIGGGDDIFDGETEFLVRLEQIDRYFVGEGVHGEVDQPHMRTRKVAPIP